jgi:hypothetical protein
LFQLHAIESRRCSISGLNEEVRSDVNKVWLLIVKVFLAGGKEDQGWGGKKKKQVKVRQRSSGSSKSSINAKFPGATSSVIRSINRWLNRRFVSPWPGTISLTLIKESKWPSAPPKGTYSLTQGSYSSSATFPRPSTTSSVYSKDYWDLPVANREHFTLAHGFSHPPPALPAIPAITAVHC